MMEGAIMENIKMFLGIFSAFIVLMLVVLLLRLNEVNTFQQEVNYQIERNGGLTNEAKKTLNKFGENQYGGYVSFSLDDNVNRHSPSGTNFSGFSLVEIVDEGGKLRTVERGDTQAKYGTPIKYALKREMGGIYQFFLKPSTIGESASRVRGTNNYGRE